MTKKIQFTFLILFFPLILLSDNQDIKFEHLTGEDGLSSPNVQCILQDQRGFMWFGTEDGLNKYDGYSFTIYRNDSQDSLSINNGDIRSLYEDPTGILWIGTGGGGLNRFDPETEIFTNYGVQKDSFFTYCGYVQEVKGFQYSNGFFLWAGTCMALVKFDISKGTLVRFPPTEDDKWSWTFDYIQAMALSRSGSVWIGCPDGGLHNFNHTTNQYERFLHDSTKPNSLSNNTIQSLLTDHSGNLWIGTQMGVNRFDPLTRKFTHFFHNPDNNNTLSSNDIISLFEDKSGILWVGTRNGLNRYNKDSKSFTRYYENPEDPGSLNSNKIICIFEDRSGVLWVGTDQGLNIMVPQKMQFKHYWQNPDYPDNLYNKSILSILGTFEEGKEFIWFGTSKDGLYKIDRKSGNIINYRHEPSNQNSLSNNTARAWLKSRFKGKDELWIHTANGLNRFNPATGKFTHYFHNPRNPNSISGNNIREIYQDRNGTFWVKPIGTIFQLFNRETEQFTNIGDESGLAQFFEDNAGNLWIARWGSLQLFDRKTRHSKFYWGGSTDSDSISHPTVSTIYQDNTGRLWIGTRGGGLNLYNYETDNFRRYTTKDGLPSGVIMGILEDNRGNLWLSTYHGLSKFNPNTHTFTNYDVSDGLLSNQFNHRACFKFTNGEMFFGSSRGFDAFYPDSITKNENIPAIILTDFLLFNKPVAIRRDEKQDSTGVFRLPKNISFLDKIELSYKDNIFSFEFSALDYHSPQKNQYAYKMDGVDPQWVYTDASRRFATYTNLDPGEYIFRVKGSNNDGMWNEAGTSIKIIITPPWWETNLAYIFYILLLVSIIFITWRLQLRRIHLRQKMQMEHFEAEKLREVDNLKSRFFANISHEFRTPLTLIKGPVKQIMNGEFKGNLKEKCRMILRNSDRLLGLINQILDLSKLESGEMTLKVAETDIVKFIKGLVLSFSPLAETKKVILKFSCSENSMIGYVDQDKLEKTVTNLLSNAFKFTPEGGKVVVDYQLREADLDTEKKFEIRNSKFEILQLSISNTGPGIPSDRLDKIFDRFYQADTTYKKDGEGSGIGLALTKELVEVCHGKILASSILNKITTFVVTLPIAKEYFKVDEIVEEKVDEDTAIEPTPQTPPLVRPVWPPDRGDERGVEITPPASSIEKRVCRLPGILIVEDNPDVTSYISSFMENDYRILTAENGKEGLKKTIDKYPDLIISDVMMPEMDGFELCKKIKTDERISHIPVILLTAKADLESKIEGLEFGADDYVTKPFEARELQIRSKNLIEQRRKLREKFSALIDLNPADIAASSMDEQLLQRLLAVFEEHMEEPEFSIEQLAREIGMSRIHLNRKIRAITNLSTSDFIRTLRLQRAASLLKNASGTVTEIAYKVGFNNLSYFSRTFRKHFGKLPSDFSKE